MSFIRYAKDGNHSDGQFKNKSQYTFSNLNGIGQTMYCRQDTSENVGITGLKSP